MIIFRAEFANRSSPETLRATMPLAGMLPPEDRLFYEQ
jgi:hypothetical protein